MWRTVGLSLAIVFVLSACATEKKTDDFAFDTGTLFGMVYDLDDQPCVGVAVSIDGVAGPVTDIRGRFLLQDVTRGEHAIVATKTGYEDLSVQISFLNRTDVLHLRMTSFGQLLDLAQKALGEQRWNDAESFLARATKLDPQDAVLGYLSAIHAYKTGAYDLAVQRLTDLFSKGYMQPAVYLFLADIYETKLNNPKGAIENLESYLKLRSDPDAESRLAKLKGKE